MASTAHAESHILSWLKWSLCAFCVIITFTRSVEVAQHYHAMVRQSCSLKQKLTPLATSHTRSTRVLKIAFDDFNVSKNT
jgi:hypothetical protein